MTTYIALLRAINVGGTGKLAMKDLVRACERAGFRQARTYLASGNVVFQAAETEARARAKLAATLAEIAGKPVEVVLRTGAEMARALAENPFAGARPDRTIVFFLNEAPAPDALEKMSGRREEETRLGKREIYVHYPDGQGQSKLKIPAAQAGTGRNCNTVAKLIEIAAAL